MQPPSVENLILGEIVPYQDDATEDYMNPAQKEHFRRILLAWRRSLLEELSRVADQMKGDVVNLPDSSDRATMEEEFSLALRGGNRKRKLLHKVDKTLEKVDSDDFGYCESCDVPIGIRRLEARPTATLCIDCKTLDEIRERQLWQ